MKSRASHKGTGRNERPGGAGAQAPRGAWDSCRENKGARRVLSWLTFCLLTGSALGGPGHALQITPRNIESWLRNPGPVDTVIYARTLDEYPVAFSDVSQAKQFLEELFKAGRARLPSETEYFALRFLDWTH